MNILYIWDADYPWDVRVEKITQALRQRGHDVHIAARNLKKRETHEVTDSGVHIHRLKYWHNDRLNYLLSFPLFFSPVWKAFLKKIARKYDINVVIVRDLPMTIAGISLGKKFDIPVVMDMAEDYTAMIRDIWTARKFQGLNLVIRNPYIAKLVERYSIRNADRILLVTEEASQVVARAGGDASRCTIVSNTPSPEEFNSGYPVNSADIDFIAGRYSVIYTGGIQMGRGIQTVINAIPLIIKRVPDFLFVIIGDGYAVGRLKQLAEEAGVQEHVRWQGWVQHKDIYAYINACKAGIIPHLATDHVNTTIPNKIFDYMGCGLPVVASDAPPLKRIIDEENCGKSFASGDPESLAAAIISIYQSDTDYGEAGMAAIKDKYNWNVDKFRLFDMLNGISQAG